MFSKMKELGPRLDGGPKTKVPLHDSGVGRKRDDGVGGEEMRLEAEEI